MQTTKLAFIQLTEAMRSRIIRHYRDKHALKGSTDPMKDALLEIARYKPKTREAWNNKVWECLKSIDRKRQKLGLPVMHTAPRTSSRTHV